MEVTSAADKQVEHDRAVKAGWDMTFDREVVAYREVCDRSGQRRTDIFVLLADGWHKVDTRPRNRFPG